MINQLTLFNDLHRSRLRRSSWCLPAPVDRRRPLTTTLRHRSAWPTFTHRLPEVPIRILPAEEVIIHHHRWRRPWSLLRLRRTRPGHTGKCQLTSYSSWRHWRRSPIVPGHLRPNGQPLHRDPSVADPLRRCFLLPPQCPLRRLTCPFSPQRPPVAQSMPRPLRIITLRILIPVHPDLQLHPGHHPVDPFSAAYQDPWARTTSKPNRGLWTTTCSSPGHQRRYYHRRRRHWVTTNLLVPLWPQRPCRPLWHQLVQVQQP